jgi:hypothetical protein
MLDPVLQLDGLSLPHLELLISLVQLSLEVVDVAPSSDQLILGVLQPGAGVVEEVLFHVAAVVGPHQLVIQLLDCHTPLREIGNEASIRVPRMFKSHA